MRDLLDFYTNAPLLELGFEADRVRAAKHPHGVVTYIVRPTISGLFSNDSATPVLKCQASASCATLPVVT